MQVYPLECALASPARTFVGLAGVAVVLALLPLPAVAAGPAAPVALALVGLVAGHPAPAPPLGWPSTAGKGLGLPWKLLAQGARHGLPLALLSLQICCYPSAL